MRIQRVLYSVGNLIAVLGMFMILPFLCALAYREGDWQAFAMTVPITLAAGGVLMLFGYPSRHQVLRQRESYFFVSASWILAACFGALPYIFYGVLPDFASAFFEAISGFTTTGASAINDVEAMPHGLVLWRSTTNWLGGAGIVALFGVLIQRGMGGGGEISAFKAEYSGGALSERIAPRIRDNIMAICLAYLGLTILIALLYLFCGMPLFDSINHSFSVVATGGFSTKNASIAGYQNSAIEWVSTLGMFLAGINLTLYCMLFKQDRRNRIWQNDELKYYTVICLAISLLIAANLFFSDQNSGSFIDAFRLSSFQTVSLITTTGLCSANYDLWPHFSRILLFLTLFCGGCSGSTTSSVKISRWIIIYRTAIAEMKSMFHPHMFRKIFFNQKLLSEKRIRNILVFFFLYIFTYFIGVLALAMTGLDFLSCFSGAAATLGNVGPAIGVIGPVGNYSVICATGKWIFSFLMLAGRLEIMTLLVLLLPGIWQKN